MADLSAARPGTVALPTPLPEQARDPVRAVTRARGPAGVELRLIAAYGSLGTNSALYPRVAVTTKAGGQTDEQEDDMGTAHRARQT